MGRGVLAYVRRHHLALLALFVALGGTAAAAGTALLPRNSVGSGQVINGSLQKGDLSRLAISSLKGNRGPQGPQGLQGLQGLRGLQGLQGPQGLRGPQGPKGEPNYKRTVLVSPVGTNAQNGAALRAAVDSISSSGTNPYLVKLEPGTYDLGSQGLHLKPFLELEGSGLSTVVEGEASPAVWGAAGATIRNLTVESVAPANTGGVSIAIYAPALSGFHLQGVRAIGSNYGGEGVGLLVSGGPAGGAGTTVVDSSFFGYGGTELWAAGVLVNNGNPPGTGRLYMDRSFAQGVSSGGDGMGMHASGANTSATVGWSDLRGTHAIRADEGHITVIFSLLWGPAVTSGSGSLLCASDLAAPAYSVPNASCF